MPVNPTYPGVYLEELPSTTHSVIAAPTSNAAVIDWFPQGPVNQAVQITSISQFNTVFGGVAEGSEGSYAVQQFFLNGGSLIWVVRVVPQGLEGGEAAEPAFVPITLNGSTPSTYYVLALNPGSWGEYLAIGLVLQKNVSTSGAPLYTLYVAQTTVPETIPSPPQQPATLESYYNVSLTPGDSTFIVNMVNGVSQYVVVQSSLTGSYVGAPPTMSPAGVPATISASPDWTPLGNGADGSWSPEGTDFTDALIAQVGGSQTLYQNVTPALSQIAPQVFNILVIPAVAILPASTLIVDAVQFCSANSAFLIVDPPPPSTILQNLSQSESVYPWIGSITFVDPGLNDTGILNWVDSNDLISINNDSAALYYPWLSLLDPVNNFQPRLVGPSGTLAGIYAANDLNYGVWKAPAGVNAALQGVTLSTVLTDQDSGILNPQGINALRSFPIYNSVVWGARTLAGADLLDYQYKYINVRRLTDFIEQSLTQSLKWAVFEPNGPTLWSSITLEVSSFLAGLFGQGAFQGSTASAAYFVQCDSTTTTPQDMLNGVVNVVVGFAPILPAEFVILQIELQLAQASPSS